MKLFLVYAVLFSIGVVAFVIALAPASLLWQFSRENVSRALPELNVLVVNGTLWSGNAYIRYDKFPDTRVNWSAKPASLLHGRLDVDGVATGDNLYLTVDSRTAPSQLDITATGAVESSYINKVSRGYGLTCSGRITIDRMHLISDFSWFSAADGHLSWNGGNIMYNTAHGMESIILPALVGILHRNGNDLQLDIKHDSDTLIVVTLRPTGWVAVDTRDRAPEPRDCHGDRRTRERTDP